MDSTPFYIFLFLHLSCLILGFGSVLVTDLYGLLWIRDHIRFARVVKLSGVTEKFVWAGWIGMVAAGIPLIVIKGEIDNLMAIKLFFVALVGANGVPLHYLHKALERFEGSDSPPNILLFRTTLGISVSQLAWWGAIAIGFLHRHVQTIIDWPPMPWLVSGAILAGILLIWAMGEAVFKVKKAAD
ncbi:hypothetical protein BH23VER1_BH23VER1_35650 [soil metagenome]